MSEILSRLKLPLLWSHFVLKAVLFICQQDINTSWLLFYDCSLFIRLKYWGMSWYKVQMCDASGLMCQSLLKHCCSFLSVTAVSLSCACALKRQDIWAYQRFGGFPRHPKINHGWYRQGQRELLTQSPLLNPPNCPFLHFINLHNWLGISLALPQRAKGGKI